MPSIKKRHAQIEPIREQNVTIPFFEKTFATSQCIWCFRAFEDFQIYCEYCKNCQYCGMVTISHELCQNCGNRVDDELRHEPERGQTIIFNE